MTFWADANEDVALQQYQTLVNTLDDGLCQLDADGYFVAANDVIVEATGYAREDLLGAHASLILDDADRVFEVFQSLHASSDHSDTGIGLALCQRIIERHGGNIWVESVPDEGATFSFTLPKVHETERDRDE